jgi:hypothetical protein
MVILPAAASAIYLIVRLFIYWVSGEVFLVILNNEVKTPLCTSA